MALNQVTSDSVLIILTSAVFSTVDSTFLKMPSPPWLLRHDPVLVFFLFLTFSSANFSFP